MHIFSEDMKGKNDQPDRPESNALRGVFRLLTLLIASLIWFTIQVEFLYLLLRSLVAEPASAS